MNRQKLLFFNCNYNTIICYTKNVSMYYLIKKQYTHGHGQYTCYVYTRVKCTHCIHCIRCIMLYYSVQLYIVQRVCDTHTVAHTVAQCACTPSPVYIR